MQTLPSRQSDSGQTTTFFGVTGVELAALQRMSANGISVQETQRVQPEPKMNAFELQLVTYETEFKIFIVALGFFLILRLFLIFM